MTIVKANVDECAVYALPVLDKFTRHLPVFTWYWRALTVGLGVRQELLSGTVSVGVHLWRHGWRHHIYATG